MGKQKRTTAAAATAETKSTIPGEQDTEGEDLLTPPAGNAEDQAEDAVIVRILFRGGCPKLTPRGVGNLEYEIGVNDKTDEAFLRIARNESSGAFSTHWIGVDEIRAILDGVQDQSFKAIILRDLYMQKSSNNHGFLTAALKAEGVVVNLPKQMTVMCLGSWEPLMKKIDGLKVTDVNLTDHIAIATKKRADERVERLAKAQATRAKEKESTGKESVVIAGGEGVATTAAAAAT
jgi:hypothetical protein